MSGGTEPVSLGGESALDEEDRARADIYGVLARLWYRAPDRELLDALAGNTERDEAHAPPLARAWGALAKAAADADPEALTHEYDSLFVGTGRAEITLYCSHYLTETGRERVVVALREKLRELGLGRSGGTSEPEDHFSALLEVMRHLIVQGSDVPQIEVQKQFFLRYIHGSYTALTDAVANNGGAGFYKEIARVTRAFLDVESQSMDML